MNSNPNANPTEHPALAIIDQSLAAEPHLAAQLYNTGLILPECVIAYRAAIFAGAKPAAAWDAARAQLLMTLRAAQQRCANEAKGKSDVYALSFNAEKHRERMKAHEQKIADAIDLVSPYELHGAAVMGRAA